MRSRALQALHPMRVASPSIQLLRSPARRSPILKQLARAASSSSYTPKPRTAASSTPSSRSRIPPVTKRPISPSSGVNGVIDPQAAIPQAATVADVDPALAAQIPTPETSSSSSSSSSGTAVVPSPAFTAALSGGGGANNGNGAAIDWSSSFHGLSTTPFSPETAAMLMQPLDPLDIEVKPDGIIYLPEIKYRRILNQAFGPGGWGLAPRGDLVVGEKVVTREYALVVHGRFIAQARGECQYFSEETIPTAGEGCKSNALLRCCKDLGIASELWDPRFIREFKKAQCQELWVEHVVNKKRRQIWTRKDTEPAYPYQPARAASRM
ncbi:mitochondrial genome maintenance MGM101-domain-containing protein [Chaetomidium leptoderma]|uniref:Mitochondrial genome maintenance protein MGM101 n=1 Tax=Chaetomidium leptoderma TaxID=669021 RepID=A0AAN6VQT0_9PEZI|nr:mitochondrial genome maintenance MGM101-domain-containing protein [Chaetomidium leptoderma]